MDARPLLVGLVCVSLIGACAGTSGSAAPAPSSDPTRAASSPSPSPAPSRTPAAPTPSPSPVVPAVGEVVPPNTEAPEGDGTLGLDWVLATKDEGWGTGIVHGPAGWLYVALFDGEIPMIPRLRLSSDLRTWDEQKPDIAGMEGGSWALAASDTAYVLAGQNAGVWRSTDGRRWTAVAAADGAGSSVDASGVVSDGRGFVAWRGPLATDGLWTSRDGRTWVKVALPGAPAVIVDAVTAQPSGGYVLAGRAGETPAALDAVEGPAQRWEARPGTQAVWTSIDGATWLPVPMGAGFKAARITGVAAGGPGGGILAVGNDGLFDEQRNVERGVVVWRWADRVGWERLMGQGFPPIEQDAGATRVLATPDRWLIVGSRMRADARNVLDLTPQGVVAGSEDGSAWWAVAPVVLGSVPPNYYLDAIGTEPGRLVFLTNSGPSIVGTVRIWVSPTMPKANS